MSLCMDYCLIRLYGFMTTICPYMYIPGMGLIMMTSGISIYGHKGESYILVREEISDLHIWA